MTRSADPDAVRGENPAAWPQVPYDEPPPTPERSLARHGISADTGLRLRLRDGVQVAYDVFRPDALGQRFPALIAWSPYGRQLQRTDVPIPQNEAGITQFWVPRGYAHVIADARGSNDSEGDWDLMGPVEQRDLVELIEHVARQPWCDGRVGMAGCSYFGVSQYLAAEQQAPSLRAIFPHDAFTDQYRECFFHGGIPAEGFQRDWSSAVSILSTWSGRRSEISGMQRHFTRILGLEEPFDGPYYQERSAWPALERIRVPAYFGTNWRYTDLHLRGAFQAYGSAGDPRRRLLLGPLPTVRRPFATYHVEALRWYDQWLKDLDSGVMDGDPIRIWVQGEQMWRGEREWPLARTRWTELFLGGPEGGLEGVLGTTPVTRRAARIATTPRTSPPGWAGSLGSSTGRRLSRRTSR